MKFIVVGLGSIGKRHILNLIKKGINPNNITGVDPRNDRILQAKKICRIQKFFKS